MIYDRLFIYHSNINVFLFHKTFVWYCLSELSLTYYNEVRFWVSVISSHHVEKECLKNSYL